MKTILLLGALLSAPQAAAIISPEALCWPTVVHAHRLPDAVRQGQGEEQLIELYRRAQLGDDSALKELFQRLNFQLTEFARRHPTTTIPVLPPLYVTPGSVAHEVLLVVAHHLQNSDEVPQPFLAGIYQLAWDRAWGARRGKLELLDEQIRFENLYEAIAFANQLAPRYRRVMELWLETGDARYVADKTKLHLNSVVAAIARIEPILLRAAEDDKALRRDRYLAAIEDLSEPRRKVMRLWLQGYSTVEISKKLNDNNQIAYLIESAELAVRAKINRQENQHPELYRKMVDLLEGVERKVLERALLGQEPTEISLAERLSLSTTESAYYRLRSRFEAALSDATFPMSEDQEKLFLQRCLWPTSERRAFEWTEAGFSESWISQQLKVGLRGVRVLIARAQMRERKRLEVKSPQSKEDFYRRVLPYIAPPAREVVRLFLENVSAREITLRTGLTLPSVRSHLKWYREYIDDAFETWDQDPSDPEQLRQALAMAQMPPMQRRALQRHFAGTPVIEMTAEFDLTFRAMSSLMGKAKRELDASLAREAETRATAVAP